jgi:hypothetical protein
MSEEENNFEECLEAKEEEQVAPKIEVRFYNIVYRGGERVNNE